MSGVSLPTIQNIEAGIANPSFETIEALCRALHLNISIRENHADLNLLIAAGFPLASHNMKPSRVPTSVELKNELLVLCLELPRMNKKEERVVEAAQAFIASIHSHFPTWFKENLSKVPAVTENLPRRMTGRHIKLSKIAHDKLSQVL